MAMKAAAGKSINRKPEGLGKSTYPMAKGKGAKGPGANRARFGKAADTRKTGKGASTKMRLKSLEGRYF